MVVDIILERYSFFQDPFSYHVPEAMEQEMCIGLLVRVPFRGTVEKGIIIGVRDIEALPTYRDVLEIVNKIPVVFSWQIEMAQWMSDYYICPLYKTLDLFLPRYVWQEKQEDWVERTITISLRSAQVRGTKEKKVVALLEEKDRTFVEIKKNIPTISLPYLRTLEEKGVLSLIKGDIIPPYFKEYDVASIAHIQEKGLHLFTSSQKKVYDTLKKMQGKPFLLHGITGSGKTEIYLRMAYDNYMQQKQTLILVPEITLTPQLIAYFFKVFGKHISVIHSQLSDGERFTEWVRIKQKETYVVIGSRSALYAPFIDLGGIVLDEEHEWTYKSDQSPRYHARTVAIEMGRRFNIPVILGSATPDVESYYKAKQGEYILLEMLEKIGKIPGHTNKAYIDKL